MFHLLKKSSKIKHINVSENFMEFDGVRIRFPLSLHEIGKILGDCEEVVEISHGSESFLYIFHQHGIVFKTCDEKCIYLKSRKAFIDDQHNITYCYLYYGNTVSPMWRETKLPNTICKVALSFNEKPIQNFFTFGDRAEVGSFSSILWTNQATASFLKNGNPSTTLSLAYTPKRTSELTSYKIKTYKEELLEFDNLNFKLAILQVLIYELELLTPYFDIYEFAEQYSGKEIDTESEIPIKAVLNYFKRFPIPKRFADSVTELSMDGGNEIYMNISPLWSGEENYFDLNEVSFKELSQFTNLKEATIMSSSYEKIAAVFHQAGITTESL